MVKESMGEKLHEQLGIVSQNCFSAGQPRTLRIGKKQLGIISRTLFSAGQPTTSRTTKKQE